MPIALPLLLLAAQQGGLQPQPPGVSQPAATMPPATMTVEPVAMAIVAWDADGDGRTSRAELARGVAKSFAAIEPRPGATIGYVGYSDWAERWLGDRNALPSPFEVDADGDDRIGLDELQAAMAAAFDRLDRDHDGVVTRAEALTIRAARTGGAGDGGRGRRGGSPPR